MRLNKKDMNLYDTIFSGQCFRMSKEEDGSYILIINDRVLNLKEYSEYIEVKSNEESNLEEVLTEYFDLKRDYSEINKTLSANDNFMKKIISKCTGYKILKQDPFEMIISYIISQNNSVKRISKSINMLCENYGEKIILNKKEYFLFPTFDSIKNITSDELRAFGIGFRDKYIISALDYLKKCPSLVEDIKLMKTEEALKELLKIKGIGPKVASCILLFGYGKLDVYPIDTWVKKNIEENYKEVKKGVKNIEEFTKNKFGIYSGIAIQYMFHYERNKNSSII